MTPSSRIVTAFEIDVTSRLRTAEIYRHFATGSVTNWEMEAELPRSSEHGLHEIFVLGIWPLYDDLHEHKLTDRYRLTPEGREHVARVILFLHSSLPYRWPTNTGWRWIGALLVSMLTLGRLQLLRLRGRRYGEDDMVWPFFNRAEYELALKDPPYLTGKKSA